MQTTALDSGLKIFSTCPVSHPTERQAYLRRVQEIGRWSEDAGYEGILVFSDNAQLDPWLVSQAIVTATRRLRPLVAIQPAYMHPYSVAKMVSSFAFLYGRRVHLNMVANGFKNDLAALNDQTPNDDRYTRLVEYTTIVRKLLQTAGPVSFDGRYNKVAILKLTPPLPAEFVPDILVSGFSEAGRAAARQLQATAIEYPKPPAEHVAARPAGGDARGIRIGIIARRADVEAWSVARARFPEDRRGQLAHPLAVKASGSSWHAPLSRLASAVGGREEPYWLAPCLHHKAACPYLVGSYERVADQIARYVASGCRTFILETPANQEEIYHAGIAFERAVGRVAA
jgi:alkanesulfonate monooxygenase